MKNFLLIAVVIALLAVISYLFVPKYIENFNEYSIYGHRAIPLCTILGFVVFMYGFAAFLNTDSYAQKIFGIVFCIVGCFVLYIAYRTIEVPLIGLDEVF